jgi:hypothetical protein
MQTRYATIVSRHGCRKGHKTVCSQLRDWGALIPFLATSQFLQYYPDGGGSMTEGGVIQGEGSVLAHRGFIAFAPKRCEYYRAATTRPCHSGLWSLPSVAISPAQVNAV